MGYVKVPSWDGQATTLNQYRLDVTLLENAVSKADKPAIASRLLGELTGTASKHLHVEPELISDPKFKVEGGHWALIEYLAMKLGVTTNDEQHKAFNKYFFP